MAASDIFDQIRERGRQETRLKNERTEKAWRKLSATLSDADFLIAHIVRSERHLKTIADSILSDVFHDSAYLASREYSRPYLAIERAGEVLSRSINEHQETFCSSRAFEDKKADITRNVKMRSVGMSAVFGAAAFGLGQAEVIPDLLSINGLGAAVGVGLWNAYYGYKAHMRYNAQQDKVHRILEAGQQFAARDVKEDTAIESEIVEKMYAHVDKCVLEYEAYEARNTAKDSEPAVSL